VKDTPTFVTETTELFESRKADHIRLSLSGETQTTGASGLDRVRLRHEALPDLNFEDISLTTNFFGRDVATPLFVSSMTAGHAGSTNLNLAMARVSEKRNWPMGVGSQRKQLTDSSAALEWKNIRKACPRVRFLGNIGIAQVIQTSVGDIRKLTESLEAEALFVHLNPLQECLQPEGTPQFRGGLQALEKLVRELQIPVIVKETGCGFTSSTLRKLSGIGLHAVDVSGGEMRAEAAQTFRDWGMGTVESLQTAMSVGGDFEVWASGGVRSGLDAAKLIAMGAREVGLAQPIIGAATDGEDALDRLMARLEFELRTALFCTGAASIEEFRKLKAWEQI
jgi:isopentenyl-diphosphate delta-isomerase